MGHFAVRFNLRGLGDVYVEAIFDNNGRGKFQTRHEAGSAAKAVLMAHHELGEMQVVAVTDDARLIPVMCYVAHKLPGTKSVRSVEPRFVSAEDLETIREIENENCPPSVGEAARQFK